MIRNLNPEEEAQMWRERTGELETAMFEAISVIKTLRDHGEWPSLQKDEINRKLIKLENKLIPF